LLTRPVEDSRTFANALAEAGVESLISPLMDIEIDRTAMPDLEGVQALLFTSANGVRAFAAASPERDLPVYAVGDASARAAQEAGFQAVTSANGDVDDLARLVVRECDPIDGELLHVAGSSVAGDLAGALEFVGHGYRRAVMYAAVTAERLPTEAAAALRDGDLDGVALFSPRSAVILEKLVEDAGLTPKLTDLVVYALSENVANALHAAHWREIRTADAPNANALLKVVSAARQTG